MKTLSIELREWEAKLLLESIAELDAKWARLCETSSDPDEIADIGNDLIELRMVRQMIRNQAVDLFGPDVETFDRSSL